MDDESFLAAWLGGSFGRGTQDRISDLDLHVVVDNKVAGKLCSQPWRVGPSATEERLALVSQFGKPSIIHENHRNAPNGGTFTFVLYRNTALMVDWILIPRRSALRADNTRLLFDEVGIPEESRDTSTADELTALASEQVAFFWMMAAVTAKEFIRQDELRIHVFLDRLHRIVNVVKGALSGSVPAYEPSSFVGLLTTPDEQVVAIRQVCSEMLNLMTQLESLGGEVPTSPMPEIEVLLGLAIDGEASR